MKSFLKTSSIRRSVLLPCVLSLTLAGSTFAKEHEDDDHEEVIAWADVPAAVQATIKHEAGDAKIVEVERETEDGHVTFDAEIQRADGSHWEIEVDAAGKLQKIEREDDEHDEHGEKPSKKKSKKEHREKADHRD